MTKKLSKKKHSKTSLVKSERTAILYSRVKQINKDYIYKIMEQDGFTSLSQWMDLQID